MTTLMAMKLVCKRTSLSRASVYRKVADGTFPAPIALGDRKRCEAGKNAGKPTGRIGWIEHEVEEWIASRIKAGRITQYTTS